MSHFLAALARERQILYFPIGVWTAVDATDISRRGLADKDKKTEEEARKLKKVSRRREKK